MNKQYTFTCHSTPHLFEGHSDGIEYTIHAEKTLDEMLESFRNFLIASGYQFKITETIQVVDEDWHEPGEGLDDDDDDLPTIKVANIQRGEIFWTDEAEELDDEGGVTLAYNPHQASIFWTNEGTTMGTVKGGTDAE